MENIIFANTEILLQLVSRNNYHKNLILVGSGYSVGDPFMGLPNLHFLQDKGTVIHFFFQKECSGLKEAGLHLAHFLINHKSFLTKEDDVYENIILIGHSKCGVMFYSMLSYLKEMEQEITLISISSPYQGCFWADKTNVEASLPWLGRILYNIIFSNHKVDQDIAPNSSFLKEHNFIAKRQSSNCMVVNIAATFQSLANCWKHPSSFLLAFLSKTSYMRRLGANDGIVSLESQTALKSDEQYCISATHADSFVASKEIIQKFL